MDKRNIAQRNIEERIAKRKNIQRIKWTSEIPSHSLAKRKQDLSYNVKQ
jgi:hypothetical protein